MRMTLDRDWVNNASQRFFTAILFASFSIAGPARGAGIQINELMASNQTGRLDPDFNQFADWIEIHNTTASTVQLGGYSLADDPLNPGRWTFPAGVSIPANGYLLIYTDGENVKRNALHANFKLKAGGESVWLFDGTGKTVDSVIYEDQAVDVSYGRQGNGSLWMFFANPTPGAANGSSGIPANNTPEPRSFPRKADCTKRPSPWHCPRRCPER